MENTRMIKQYQLPENRQASLVDLKTSGDVIWIPRNTDLMKNVGALTFNIYTHIMQNNINEIPCTSKVISEEYMMGAATTSHHIRRLVALGYVRKEGQSLVAIDKEGVYPHE